MEVLRDGAAAQYGSDAIAGVLNFVLKDADGGVTLEARYGAYAENSGEDMTTIAANVGLPLAGAGFANLSFEYGESAPTDRSVQHRDATALIGLGIPNVAVPAKPWGAPTVDDSIKAVANIGMDLGAGSELYAFGNYASREVSTAFFFRSPMNRNGVYKTGANKFLVGGEGCAAKYGGIDSTADNLLSFREMLVADNGCFSFVETLPEGFTPQFGATLSDFSGVVGARGELANGLMWDISASIGENSLAAFNHNTLNASLGPDTPRDFDIGDYTQRETNFNADLVYPVDLGGSDLNVAAGFEARTEEFQIAAGERAAWEIGPYNQYGFASGSNGFGGFNPAASGTWDRGNVAGYLDLELNATEAWRIGGALRFEDFDGFGSTTNFKLATHLRLSDSFALRGSVGSGFRAPTPGQSNARNLSTVVNAVTNEFEERGTIGATHPVAMALGGRELQPEESRNLSVGAVFAAANGFSLTVDYFSVDIEDRIALSGLFDVTDDIKRRLVADGVPEANEFTSIRLFHQRLRHGDRGHRRGGQPRLGHGRRQRGPVVLLQHDGHPGRGLLQHLGGHHPEPGARLAGNALQRDVPAELRPVGRGGALQLLRRLVRRSCRGGFRRLRACRHPGPLRLRQRAGHHPGRGERAGPVPGRGHQLRQRAPLPALRPGGAQRRAVFRQGQLFDAVAATWGCAAGSLATPPRGLAEIIRSCAN